MKQALNANIAVARAAELPAVIAAVKAEIELWGITPNDLFGKAKRPVAPKYRDPATGATWSGRGRAPRWIAGKDYAQFAV